MSDMERRYRKFETRASEDGKGLTLYGYIALYDSLSDVLTDADGESFIEVIKPGAFTKSLNRNDIRALWNHSTDHVLGRTASGTLTLTEDQQGVAFSLQLPETQCGRDLAVLVNRGDVSGCSFGFFASLERCTSVSNELPLRELLEVDVLECSICTFPAYPETSCHIRSLRSQGKPSQRQRQKMQIEFLLA